MTVAEAMVKYEGKVKFPEAVDAAQKCLLPGEEVLFADSGIAYQPDSDKKTDVGIFVITQKRVFFSCVSTLYRRVSEIPLKGITGMQQGRKSWLNYTLRIEGLTENITLIAPDIYIRRYQVAVQRAIDLCVGEETATQPAAPAAESMEEQLMSLKRLLDGGIITQEEFEAKKKQILGI